MRRTTIKTAILAFILATALPLAACSDDDTPTSPTQPGPPVSETPTTPTPPPTTPEPTPPPTPTPPDETVTLTGEVANLNRSGANGLDVTFRIDRETIVRAAAGTPVVAGSRTGDTDFLRNGQQVTAQGRRSNGFLDATRIEITAEGPQ
jgi:hypothetical protein